jgi:hypothetical protein
MAVDAPTRELLVWISERPRTYADVVDSWRSNCPRLAVWDDAVSDGLVRVARVSGGAIVTLTERGHSLLGGAK